jgi:hypothetical protein
LRHVESLTAADNPIGLVSAGCAAIGAPQFGQVGARSDTSRSQSGQLISGID